MKNIFVIFFNTHFPDLVSAAVIHRIKSFKFIFRNTAKVTDSMGKVLTLRVVTHQFGINTYSRKTILVNGNPGDFLFTQIIANGNG